VLGFWTLRRYRRTSTAFDPLPQAVAEAQKHLAIRAEFRCSEKIQGPITFGLRRPLVLLPAGYFEMAPGTQDAIACHELIHVRRRDWALTIFEELVLTAFWFHPGIWWLVAQIRLAREQVVDRQVAGIMTTREQYVEALLEVARFNQRMRFAPANLFLRRRYLFQRAAAVIKEHTMSRRRLIASSITALCALLVVMRLGTWLFPFQARAQERSIQPVQVESGEDGLLHWAPIPYPGRAIERRIEGTVMVELDIDEHGLVSGARVLSGPEELRRSTLQSLLEWHYDPAKRAAGKAQVSIRYRLPNQEPVNSAEQELDGRQARLEVLLRESAETALGSEERASMERELAGLKAQFSNGGEQEARARISRLEELLRASQNAPGPEAKERLEKQIAELKMELASYGVVGGVPGGVARGVIGGVVGGVPGGVSGGVINGAIDVEPGLGSAETLERQAGDTESGTVQSIRTERLAPSARAELLSRLPLHVGDPISGETVKKIEEVLATFDEHLSLRLESDGAGNVSLMILPQNEPGPGQHEFHGDRYWFPGPASGTVENRQKPAAPR
jgi:TonB family protein